MEDLEMFKVDESGQLFIDWDSLESLTNSDFVFLIKMGYDRVKKFLHSVKIVNDAPYYLTVFIESQTSVSFYRFIYDGQLITNGNLTQMDINIMSAMSKGEYRRG